MFVFFPVAAASPHKPGRFKYYPTRGQFSQRFRDYAEQDAYTIIEIKGFKPGDSFEHREGQLVRLIPADHSAAFEVRTDGRGEDAERWSGAGTACHAAEGNHVGHPNRSAAFAHLAETLKTVADSGLAISLRKRMLLVAGSDNVDALNAAKSVLARQAADLFFAGDAERTYPQLVEFKDDLLNLSGDVFIDENREVDEEGALAAITARFNALKETWAVASFVLAGPAAVSRFNAAGVLDTAVAAVSVAQGDAFSVMMTYLRGGGLLRFKATNGVMQFVSAEEEDASNPVVVGTLPSSETRTLEYAQTATAADADWGASPVLSASVSEVFVRLAAAEDAS